ncbi:MAG: preprotein translocase subunit SecG [Methylococcales bacterium]|nr:preprotein translocase subunit SecG [Methylococcales bacterium]
MYQAIIVVHVLLGLGVVGLVLIQQGKGADAGAAFGSASSGSVFGAQGASSFLSRTTAILAALFFSTSLGLAVIVGNNEGDTDLMAAPEVENVLADVPLVNNAEAVPVLDSLPVVKEEVPAALTEETKAVTE